MEEMKMTLKMKLLSIALALIMVFVSYIAIPAKALAEDAEEAAQAEAIEAYADANDFSQDNALEYSPLIGELSEGRDESIKVFRRADGAKEAVIYSDPIHYLNGEVWEPIDNTLELVTLENGTQVYRNKANDFVVSFSTTFSADNLITVESKGHILSWRFAEEVLFAQEEPVKEATEAPAAEVSEEPEQNGEQPAEEPEDTETAEEPGEEQDDQETPSDESEAMEVSEESEQEETETPIEEEETDAEIEPEESEEVPSEEPEVAETVEPEETTEEPEAEDEPAYETLKITDTKAEVVVREQKEPETDEERDMQMRFPEELTSELTYKDPETGLNVHYVLSGKRLSEQIVLDHAPETAIAYSTLLTTDGLKAEEKDGQIVFVDEAGEVIFEIMAPFMYDANGEECDEIDVRLIETEDGYAYTLIPNEKWLKDESRVYPVTIDPDVHPQFAGSVADTYVRSDEPNTNFEGRDRVYLSPSESHICYALIRLDNLPALRSGDIVLHAAIHLSRYESSHGYVDIRVTGHRITSGWAANTVTYNSLPSYESTASTFAISPYDNVVSSFDLTSLVKDWYDTTASNNGILLKSSGYAQFRSSEYNEQYPLHPYFTVIYRNSTGLEGNWTYYSQSAGRAGTGSVNLASGNLTWTLSDGGITNGALPISLSHVYNVNDIGSNLGYGRGWRVNYAQTLKRFPVVNGNETTLYYEYTDGDGTRHYYKYQDGEYLNEIDKDSKLTFNSGGTEATITDKGGNKLVFEIFTSGSGSTLEKNGRLIRVEDANGNKTLITYLSSAWSLRIHKIVEQLSGESTGQELVFAYNGSNFLSSITTPNGLNVTFTYSSNDDLAKASYTDGKSVTFNYVEHRLAKATNIDGYNLRYVYNDRNGIRKVTEYAGNTRGNGLLFEYGRNKAVVTELDIDDQLTSHKVVYMTDSLGQPISVTDSEGRAIYAAYHSADRTVTQLSAVSKLQNTVVNRLKNHGFERNTLASWTASGSASVDWAEKKDGRHSLKFMTAATEQTVTQTVAVESGKTYTLSAYVKGSGSLQLKAITGANTVTGDVVPANSSDWTRASLTFTAAASSVTVVLAVPANGGTLHIDSAQLEEGPAPNRYNLVENADFEDGLTGFGNNHEVTCGVTTATGGPQMLEGHVYRFAAQMDNESYVSQIVYQSGQAGDTYSFGAWLKSDCPPESMQWFNKENYPGQFTSKPIGVKRLTVEFLDANGAVLSDAEVSFAVDTKDWQFASGVAVAEHNYASIRIKAFATRCVGSTLVDGIQLYRETFSQAYSYDENGNLTGYTSLIGQENSFEYNSTNDVTSVTDPRGNTTEYGYDNRHNVTSVKTAENVRTAYSYNAKGQVYHTRVGTDALHMDTYAEHGSWVGFLLTKTIDARGKEVKYTYDGTTRLNTQITDPKGNTSTYVYGNAAAMHRLASLTSTGLGTVEYFYDAYGKLTKIQRGSTEYNLTYNSWNQPVSTKVGTTALSTNTYDNQKRLSTVTYANGFSARYVYDNLDRVSQIYQTENSTESLVYEMIYNGEGDLYELRNYRTLRASFFEYDHAGRCMASKERSFTVSGSTISYGSVISSYAYQYDACNNLTKLTCSVAGASWDTVYTYDADNRPKTTTTWSGTVLTNTYDSLGRLTKRTWGLGSSYETRLEYWLNGDNRTTLLHRYYNGNDDPYVYNYDNNGNIISITQGSTSISYTYDAANRLTRENNQVTNQTVTYEYDVWGNILNKKVYAYTTEQDPGTPIAPAVTYAYETGTNSWGDKLTSYDGQTITYDAMGNPLTYRGYTFTWRGKQLVSSVNGTQTVSYEYNEDGLRQKKTVNGTETDYFYNGTVLIGMQRSGTRYLFSYDAAGKVVSVKYNNNEYYYVRNGQGDIVKLIDVSGASVVEYSYDTWGKKVTTTGSLAGTLGLIQPFRYRGYVYDYETGFYYLQSRYYDPTTGRFISADVLLSTGQGVLGHNCYAYCLDNPVNMVDEGGTEAKAENHKDPTLQGAAERHTILGLGVSIALLAIYCIGTSKPLINKKKNTINSSRDIYLENPFSYAINRPSYKTIEINMDHILSGHSFDGNRGPNKSRFPKWMTPTLIETAIRFAYKNADKASEIKRCFEDGIEVVKQFFIGAYGDMEIEMWVDFSKKMIDSAWPKE